MLLNELGLDEGLTTPLRERYLGPIASLLYPDCGGGGLDSHKAFVVKYDLREDLDLSYHYDNAEVTLNVSLGKDFTGGNLYFGDMKDVRVITTLCVACRLSQVYVWRVFIIRHKEVVYLRAAVTSIGTHPRRHRVFTLTL